MTAPRRTHVVIAGGAASQADHYRGEKPMETKFAPMWALNDVAEHAAD